MTTDKAAGRRGGGAAARRSAQPDRRQVEVAVVWSRTARAIPLTAQLCGANGAAEARQARTELNRATRLAIATTLNTAPLRIFATVPCPEGASTPLEVSVSFVDDKAMAVLNRDYRGLDRPTDVLSFSLLEEAAKEPGASQQHDVVTMLYAGDTMALGDVVISIETALRQAGGQGHSLLREVMFLAVHGTLHLCGYDHMQASERRIMFTWQDKIMDHLDSTDPMAPGRQRGLRESSP